MVKLKFAFYTISINIVGPLATCTGGFKYLIIAINDLTKWVEAKPITNLIAQMDAKIA